MNVGRVLFYDKLSGEVIVNTGDLKDVAIKKSIEQQIDTWESLSERNRESFDIIELQFGQLAQDFAECNGYRVNPETREIEFSYPDPENPLAPPVFQKALTTQIEELRQEQSATNLTVLDLMEILFTL